jgi:hypothetical protein
MSGALQTIIGGLASTAFSLAYAISPILLVNGIAANVPGGILPIAALDAVNAFAGIITGSTGGFSNPWAYFQPLPGGTWNAYEYGSYPYANVAVAVNAAIQQPTELSMLAIIPVTSNWEAALITSTLLSQALDAHINQGGYFDVLTPKQIYFDGLLRRVTDVSTTQSKQPQNMLRLDFYFPLLTLEKAAAAQNNMMSKLSSGSQVLGGGSWSSPGIASSVPTPATNGLLGSV